jgi:hypothetical protein
MDKATVIVGGRHREMTSKEINELLFAGMHSVYLPEDEQGNTPRIIRTQVKGGQIQGLLLNSGLWCDMEVVC